MNILQIVHSFPPESMTGAEIYAFHLARELAKNHKVSVFYRVKNPNKAECDLSKSRYEGLDVYKINNTLKGYRSIEKIYKNKDIDEQFGKVLDEVCPDVVHVQHLLFLSVGIIEEIKKRGIPIVFTLHDYWLVCPRGQLLKYNLKPCASPFKANCLYCLGRALSFKNLFKRAFGFEFGKRIFKARYDALKEITLYVDLFIAPSKFLMKKFIGFGIPPEKIVCSDNGMDVSLFNDIEKVRSEEIRFGFIGTLIPSKGAHVLLEVFKRIEPSKASLKIYGNAPVNNGVFDYFRKLKRMARGKNNISFMGTFDNKEVAQIFKEIDILVFPSLWEENAPLVLREAVLTKTLVIASRVGGAEEFLRGRSGGVMFEPGDKNDLYKKMDLFVKNFAEGKTLMDVEPIRIKSIKENAIEIENLYGNLSHASK